MTSKPQMIFGQFELLSRPTKACPTLDTTSRDTTITCKIMLACTVLVICSS